MKMFGHDFLGAAMYQSVIAKNFPEWAAFGAFDKEFGDCMQAANLAYTRGCRVFRIQLLWHGNHIYGDADISAIKAGAEKWSKWKGILSVDTTVYISPFCEHQIQSPDKYLKLIAEASKGACIPVNSPLKNGGLSRVYVNEFHGGEIKPRPSKTPILFSFDGTACVDADLETYKKNYAKAEVFFLWDARYNMHPETNDKARNCPPNADLLESINKLTISKGKTSLPIGDIWKSHSENKGSNDPRAEKPVYITQEKSSKVELKLNGKVIHTLTRYSGDMPDGRARYYASKMGYQIAIEPCEIWVNGKKRGVVNPAFRENEYRS